MTINIPTTDFLNGGLNPNGLTPRGATAQNVNVTDLICEGPIRGLVDGKAGLHLDDVSVEDANFIQFTSYQPPGDAQSFSGNVTFSGTAVGTLSDELDISELELDENSPRSITLQNYKTTTATVSSSVENNGATTLSLTASSGTPFTDDWNSGQQLNDKAFAVVSLVQDDFSVIGFFYRSSGSTAGFITYGVVPPTTGTFTLVVDYTIPITALDSDNNQLTLAATPASGSYKFIIGAQTSIDDNGEVAAGQSSVVSKIHKLNIDFRKGDLYQPVTSSTGGVGGAVAVVGDTSLISGPQELKIISQTLADSLGVTIFDKNGLPNTNGSQDFPGSPDFSVMADSVTVLPSSAFGLDTAVKITEADEIGFSIKYPAFQVINLQKGDKETAYAFYVMQIRFEQNGSYGSWKSLFPGDTYVRHYGNTNAPVSFDHDINLDGYRNIVGPFEDFQVRVFRVTRHIGLPVRRSGTNENDPNKKKWQLSASASIENLRAVIKDYFTYPYSSIASVSFSSRQFDGVPKRSYLLEGKLVKVPSTYTPREYSTTGIAKYEGFWDGEFSETLQYTDNPAWVFYDIVTNNRYGAGKWLKETDIDKYALYRIARYCDELVEDGSEFDSTSPLVIGEFYKIKTVGTTTWTSLGASANTVDTIFQATSKTITGTGTACKVEPRFRANVFLTKATDVYKVLKDFATIFLGILYWQDSKVTPVQDAPQDPIYNFTKGNVIDGAFSYESSGSRTRVNQVVVTWNDPTINYQPVPLVVEDRESIVRTGRIISENVVAFGATSESQAIRYGRWKLWTAQNQTELVSFKTSLAAHYVKPGDIVNIQDADRFGIAYSGRTSSATSTTLTFDRNVSFNSTSTYELSTLVTEPAALNASEDSITINSVTYKRGEKIDQAYVYDGDSYELVNLDTEERASNAFSDASGTELIPTIWKPYTYVETHEITNPGNTTNTVTLANSATFDTTPSKHNIWALKETSGGLNVAGSEKMYKILSITEESPNIFGVSAVEYFDEKFTAIEEDYALGITPSTIYIENEPVTIPRPVNPRVILATDAKKPGEELIFEWDQEDSDLIAQYEVVHNITGIESPIKTDKRQVAFNNVPNGSVTLKVRAISRKGNLSSFSAIDYGVYDPYSENVPRMPGGIPKGIVSTAQGLINSNNAFEFQATNASIASVANPFITYTFTGTKSVANISTDEEYYLYLDTATPSLKLLEYDSTALKDLQFYRDVGSGNSAISTAWTSIGTVSVAADSNEVTGSGFNTNVELRDVLNLQNSTSPSGGDGATVIAIISDTKLLIDRTFGTAKTNITGYRSAFRPDYANDAIFAEITKTGSTISTNNFITLRTASDDSTVRTGDDGTIGVPDGGIDTDQIASNAITANQVSANSIVANSIASNSITSNSIASNSITSNSIASNSITSNSIVSNSITSNSIASNSITTNSLAANSVTTDILASNSVITDSIVSNSIVTDSIAANTINANLIQANTINANLIQANTITTDELAANSITANQIQANTITTDELAANSITANQIQANSISTDELAANSITSDQIAANSISTDQLAANAITSNQIQANSILTQSLAANSVNANTITANSVSTDQLAANAVTANNIAANSITTESLAANAVTADSIASNSITTESISANSITALEISANSVSTDQLAANAITANEIQANSISTESLAANAITANQIQANSISTDELAANSITANQIAANEITSDAIAANSISTSMIASNNITASLIEANAITANEIAADAITANEIAANAITANQIAANAITANEIAANAITADEIAANAITADEIAANAITADEIEANSITADLIASNTITTNQLQANSITSEAIESNTITGNLILSESLVASNIAADTITSNQIAANGITADVVASNTITANQIAANGITADVIASNTITGNNIAANSLFAAQIASESITANQIAANTITANQISANTISANEIQANSISTDELAANAITANQIAANSISANEIQANTISANEIQANSISTDLLAANAITANQIAANSISADEIQANAISANEIQANSITAGQIKANEITTNELAANSITANQIQANSITASAITVTDLSAVSADIGDITAGTLQGGNIPDANNSPSPGESGAFLDLTDGKMVFGNPSKHILFDGTDLILSGVTIDAQSVIDASAAIKDVQENSTSVSTDIDTLNFTTGIGVTANEGVATISADTATSSVKGIASFSSSDFDVTSGAVSIKNGGVSLAQLATSNLTIGVGGVVGLGGTLPSISGLTSLGVDNLSLDGNTVSSTGNNNLNITPGGTGTLVLDGRNFPADTAGVEGDLLKLDSSGNFEFVSQANLVLDTEQIEDAAGNLIEGSTHSNISVSYDDTAGTLSFTNDAPDQTVDLDGGDNVTVTGTYPNFTINATNTQRSDGEIRTVVGGMVDGGTETDITVTYNSSTGKLNFVNDAPDQTVSLTGEGSTSVSGTYPSFTITSTQRTDDDIEDVAAGLITGATHSNISVSYDDTAGTLAFTNDAPDQTVSLTGEGATSVSGSYPNFTITSTDNNTQLSQEQVQDFAAPMITSATHSNISVSYDDAANTLTFTNDAPDQTVSIAAGTNVTVSGSYPSFTISSTDNNTQLSQEQVQDFAAPMITSATHSNISVSYDDAANTLTFTGQPGTVTSVTAGTGLSGGTITSSGTISLPNVITANTYGSVANGTKIDTITVDAQGRVTAVATGATGDILGVTAGTGLSGGGNSGAVTLNVSDLTVDEIAAGSLLIGGETFVDTDTQLMTAAAIDDLIISKNFTTDSGVTNVGAGSGLTGGGSSASVTLNVGAGSGISVAGDSVAVDSTVVRTTGAQTIGGAKTFSSNIVVSGNLTVNGTTTTVNTAELNVADNIIRLNSDFTGSNPTESAGIEVERGTQSNVLFQYKESGVGITGDLAAGWSVGTSRIEATGFYGTFYGDGSAITGVTAGDLSGLDTSDLPEDPSATTSSGTMYFTNARAQAAIGAGNGLTKSGGTINVVGGSGITANGDDIQVDSTVLRTTTTFGGDVSGPYNAIVIADDSHNHVISNVDGLQTALDGKLSNSGGALSGAINFTPDTGNILQVDGQTILQRRTANGALTFGHDDSIVIAGGDTTSVLNTNINAATEIVAIGAESGLAVYAFPNNNTAWTNRKTLTFDGVNGLNVNSNATIDLDGNISGTTKSFDISHPTKDGMRLRYASLEGPENGVYIRGKCTSDTIELPDYWEGLVDAESITVNLTPIGNRHIWVEDVLDDKIIVGSNKEIKCFYTIYAERKDVDKLVVEYKVKETD